MNWKEQYRKVIEYLKNGKRIFWEIVGALIVLLRKDIGRGRASSLLRTFILAILLVALLYIVREPALEAYAWLVHYRLYVCQFLGAFIFIVGYYGIYKYDHYKEGITSGLMVIIWVLVGLAGKDVEHGIVEMHHEVLSLILFLFIVMVLVGIIVRCGYFDHLRLKLLRKGLDDKKQFDFIGNRSFWYSGGLDNMTTSLALSEVALRFFKGHNLEVMAVAIAALANAGGAAWFIGDITTIMLVNAGKASAVAMFLYALLPSMVHGRIVHAGLRKQLIAETTVDDREEETVVITPKKWAVIILAALSLPTAIIGIQTGYPIYLGPAAGLAIVLPLYVKWGNGTSKETHLGHEIHELLDEVDVRTLLFFVTIIPAVLGLNELGVLPYLSDMLQLVIDYVGPQYSTLVIILFIILLGLISALVDNVPLVAIAILALPTQDPALWALLAYTAGTGGSLLLVGSVAGVVAAGKVAHLTSQRYKQIGTKVIFKAYLAGIAVWALLLPIYELLGLR